MSDINIKNVKKGRAFFAMFLVAGLLVLFIIGRVLVSNIIKQNSLDSVIL